MICGIGLMDLKGGKKKLFCMCDRNEALCTPVHDE